MALIDVDARIFDPATRAEALQEMVDAFGVDLGEDGIDVAVMLLGAIAPVPPDTVAEYLNVLGKIVTLLTVAAALAISGNQALEARVTALEG